MNTEIWLCEITGRAIPLHDCLECAEHRQVLTCPFPPTVLKALANSMRGDDGLLEAQALAQRAGVALLRVTSLLGCTRQAWYYLHGRPLLEKPSEHWSRLRGTIFHAALESLAGEHAVAEFWLTHNPRPMLESILGVPVPLLGETSARQGGQPGLSRLRSRCSNRCR